MSSAAIESLDRVSEQKLVLYRPHAKQLEAHNSRARYRVIVFGRQAGKSTWAINELLRWAWMYPGTTYWFISPTIAQARTQFRRLIGMLWPCREVMLKKNQSELRVKLINQSQIVFKGGDNPDSLRGETLHGAIIDEDRDQDPELFPMIIQPMLRTTGGWCAFTSTPNGFDHFYDLAKKAQDPKFRGTWAFFQAPSTCNPLWTVAEYEDAKASMTELQFRQEILAEFVKLYGSTAYVNFSDSRNVKDYSPFTDSAQISPHLPIVVGLDFNLSPMCWTLGQTNKKAFYWHDEIHLERSHTQEAALELRERVKDHKAGIILCGDASGKAGQRAAAGQSDYDIVCQVLKDAGIKWSNITPQANPAIRDRVNNVNAHFLSAAGTTTMWISRSCRFLLEDFEKVGWKEGANYTLDPGKKKLLTHQSDSVGYPLWAMDPIPSRFMVGGLSVI
jgi:hypothetical protein